MHLDINKFALITDNLYCDCSFSLYRQISSNTLDGGLFAGLKES